MARSRRQASDAEVDDLVQRVTTFFGEQYGLPPITGRVLGWLMVCDPPEQSGAEIAAGTGASRASVSNNVRLLAATGLVQRVTRPGDRTAYYRMQDDAMETAVRRRLQSLAAFRALADEGIALLGPGTARAARLEAARDVYEWMERAIAAVPGPKRAARR